MEETIGTRINHERTREALATGASIVGIGCPFCLQMFEEGISSLEASDRIRSLDLVELIDRSL
jgi:Fe-S oxidoreductase